MSQPVYNTDYQGYGNQPQQGGYYPPQQPGVSPVAPPGYGQPQQPGYQSNTTIHYHAASNTVSEPVMRARMIMTNGLCGCFDDLECCLAAWCIGPCLSGMNYSDAGAGHFLIGCCCYPLICGCSRSAIQRWVGVNDDGCVVNCCYHYWCSMCSLSQEGRAVKAMKVAIAQGAIPPVNIVKKKFFIF
eukprot:UN02540